MYVYIYIYIYTCILVYIYTVMFQLGFFRFFWVVPSGWVRVPLLSPPGAISDVVAVFFGPCILGGYASRFFCRPARYSTRRPLRRFILFWFCLPGPRFYYCRAFFFFHSGICTYIYIYIYIDTHKYIYVCIHIYIYTHINTCT